MKDDDIIIPIALGHFVPDMYMPTFRSDLSTLSEYDIEVLHFFCIKSIENVVYFMRNIGPAKLFAAYSTASVEIRIAILKFWSELLLCPHQRVIDDAVIVPWDYIMKAIKIDKDIQELQSMCEILINAFNHGSSAEEGIFSSNVVFELLNIIEFGTNQMKSVSIKALSVLIENSIASVTNYVVNNSYIEQIVELIESDNEEVVHFTLKLLLKLLFTAFQNPEIALKLIPNLSQIDFDNIDNELLDDQDKDYGAMFDLFVDKSLELIDNPPELPPKVPEMDETVETEENDDKESSSSSDSDENDLDLTEKIARIINAPQKDESDGWEDVG